MKDSHIEWTDNTINFYTGCTKISPGCQNCYMYRIEERFGKDPTKVKKTNWDNIAKNLKSWKKSKIFVNSMSDTFHESLSGAEIADMFHMFQKYPKHTYMILTKRIKRAFKWFDESVDMDIDGIKTYYPNVWLGTSIENERMLNMRLFWLKSLPEPAVRFISFEPLIGPVDVKGHLDGIDWVIVGGESGYNPRPMLKQWADPIYEECQRVGIPFFFKQWGGKKYCPCHKAWGCRTYKDRTWNEMPKLKVIA